MKIYIYSFIIVILAVGCTPAKYNGLKEGLYAEIQTNKGDVLLELYAEDAPMTVANFVSLAEGTNTKVTDSIQGKKYFDGIRFHRVVNNFIIQGGDPTETGRGTAGYRFGDEFTKDVNGKLLHIHGDAGMLSMANGGPESNGSQFFITHRAIPHLDGKHTVFGKTVVNSLQLNTLKLQIKDSLKRKNAIDSLRMSVVNSIQQFDTIFTVKIIRIGAVANAFKAGEVFDNEFIKYAEGKKDRNKKAKDADEERFSKYLENRTTFLAKMNESKAIKTASGLRILKLTSNPSGKKVVTNKPIKAHFTLYIADGTKIQSTLDSGNPFVFQLDDAEKPMITGFKEGAATLRVGEKARLFIPYYIGFGEAKYGPFPAKSDLVFEVEILEIGE
ncbi:MAG: peptidylprolyl isomerase [Polaribacter sp.]|uniref:peptidylprolyl isomerase n=1 Tax=Polaribacter sp. TaxID=1920175 RepID=UPI00260E5C85|nr:peptidylprolyl isomerase [Polaribacter sp.]MBT3742645.1 peptidylprolyl isomerase [Polaribacter sp.]MDG1194909.1 peptidylprolyl isomerase [Polaribacter sp.]MDG1403870.1 peptidylprolyl isomerase [Polaribacter sp.]MDG2437129.1 peptidylprolyl isomerase [Polaribacter sp.]